MGANWLSTKRYVVFLINRQRWVSVNTRGMDRLCLNGVPLVWQGPYPANEAIYTAHYLNGGKHNG